MCSCAVARAALTITFVTSINKVAAAWKALIALPEISSLRGRARRCSKHEPKPCLLIIYGCTISNGVAAVRTKYAYFRCWAL